MKQDLVLVCTLTEHITAVIDILKRTGVGVIQIECPYRVLSGLTSYAPAFILIDLGIEAAKHFLTKAVNRSSQPWPFILVASE